jgi:hypothetical protein
MEATMVKQAMRILLAGIGLILAGSGGSYALTLEQRVEAQQVVERIRYRHQIGAARPFEEVVTQVVIERKVRTYLQESALLETYWNTVITEESLRQEMHRIERSTLVPALLQELRLAFNNDQGLLLEAVARPSLTERLTRNFYAFDQNLHRTARIEADRLLSVLRSESRGARESLESVYRPNSSRVESKKQREGSLTLKGRRPATEQLEVSVVQPMHETRDAFVIQALLPGEDGSHDLVSYQVPKRPWESWWQEVQPSLPVSLPASRLHHRSASLQCPRVCLLHRQPANQTEPGTPRTSRQCLGHWQVTRPSGQVPK